MLLTAMLIRPFRELLAAMPADRRNKVARRVRDTVSAMPLDELHRALQPTRVNLVETDAADSTDSPGTKLQKFA